MKNILSKGLRLFVVLSIWILPLPVHAEGEDFSDTAYWNTLCTTKTDLSSAEQASCTAYMEYMRSRNALLEEQIASIDAEKDQLEIDILTYSETADTYNMKITGLNDMIEDLNYQLAAVEKRKETTEKAIAENKVRIKEQEKEVDELKGQVGARIERSQETMRVNSFIDILMGAASFDDFLRIVDCLADIYRSDADTLQALDESITTLNEMQSQLQNDQDELDGLIKDLEKGQKALEIQQADLLSSQYEAALLAERYEEELADADEETLRKLAEIEENRKKLAVIEDNLNTVPIPTSAPVNKEETPESTPETTIETGGENKPEPETPASSEPVVEETPSPTPETSYTPPSTGSAVNPYYGGWGNCVWGAWQLVYDTLGIALPGWGYSTYWLQDAQASGYATGAEPRVYSVAVYIGHVAFVTAIDGDMVYIKEGNYLGGYMERWVPKDELPYTGQTCLGYIYLN